MISDTILRRLSPKERAIYDLLSENANTFVSGEAILRTVWGPDFVGESQTLAVHICWLRKKIGDLEIVSRRKIGYKLVVPQADAA